MTGEHAKVGDMTAPLRLPFDDERPLRAAPRIREMELQAAVCQLVSRFPDLRLATEAEQLTLDTSVVTVGLAGLPVTW